MQMAYLPNSGGTMKPVFRIAMLLLMAGTSSLVFGQDRFFDSNGVRIRYLEQGTGEPVVLVHGYSGSIEMNWVAPKVFEELAKTFRVIALDCRGHGKSGKPHDPAQYGQEMAMDVVRLLDHLNIQKAHVVGYSMGAVITAKLLTLKPKRILTATFGGQGAMLDPAETEIRLYEQLGADVEKGSMRILVALISSKNQPLPSEEMMKQAEAHFRSRQDLAALAAVARSIPDLKITGAQVATIKVPAIAIIGSDDPLIDGVNKLKKAMPALKVIPVDGASHATVFGRPEFIQALQEFLRANSIKK
jgi:pimeloyl-ACP methyl ester carboxylesterase